MKHIQLKSLVFKYALVLFFFLRVFLADAQTGWRWLNPKPQGNNLKKVQVLNSQVVYASGEAGTMLKTTNGGLDWRMLRTRTNMNLNALSMVHLDSGFVVGDSGLVLRTANSGTAWFKQNTATDADLNGVHFLQSKLGWVCGENGVVMKTTNGGFNWSLQNNPATGTLHDIRFFTPSIGFVAGDSGRILKTTNGGANWNIQTSGTTKNIRFIKILDADSLFMVGDSGLVLKTTNGGTSWNKIRTDADIIDFQTFYSIGTDTLLAAGGAVNQDPVIAISRDRGQNWDVTTFQPTRPISSFSFFNSRLALAVGADGELLKTQDRFETGENLKTGFQANFLTSHFFSPDSGFVFGKESATPVLLETNNGGQTWSNATSPGLFDPQDLQFLNSQLGFTSGTGGSLSKTTNRGADWAPLTTNVTQALWGLHFLDLNFGYAVGSAGTIIKTTNSGQSWQSQTSATGTGFRIFDVFAVNQQVAYTVGEDGIQKTTNGGQNWSSQVTNDTLNSLHFFGPLAGIAVGNKGKILQTNNGGTNWTPVNLGLKMDLNKIHFASATHGIIVGDSGLVLLTLNGGQNWVRQLSYNRSGLQSAFVVNDTVAYICGSRSAILKTTTAGSTCPDATFNYTGVFLPGKFCQSDTITQSLYFDGTPGGVFSATPGGLDINGISGRINPITSIPGNYLVSYQVTPPNGCATQTFTTTAQIQAVAFIPRARLEVRLPSYSIPPFTVFTPCNGDTMFTKARNQFADLGFAWYKNNQLLPDTTQEIKVTTSGTYAVKYRDQACAGPFYDTVNIEFENAKRPEKPGVLLAEPPQNCNDDFVLTTPAGSNVTYAWVNEFGNVIPGQTGNSTTLSRFGTYSIQIDSAGCKNISDPITILPVGADTVLPNLYSVNTKGNDVPDEKNEIRWNRTSFDTSEIKRIAVYRAAENDPYQLIALRPATDTMYTDLEANPGLRTYSYRIAARQRCGPDLFFTPSSELQTSIHLIITSHPPNKKILRWNIPEGFSVSRFRILRGTNYNALPVLVDSLPGNINSFIDEPAAGQDFFYRIESETNDTYVPWGRVNAEVRKVASNTSNSTFIRCDSCAVLTKSLPKSELGDLVLFPNPTQRSIAVKGITGTDVFRLQVYHAQGALVDQLALSEGKATYSFPKYAKPGLYFFRLQNGTYTKVVKVMLE